MLTGMALGANGVAIYNGLWGFNSFDAALAIAGVFYVLTWRSALLGVACAAFTALLFGAIASIFVPWGLPALTLPFCFGTLAFVLLKDASKHFTWCHPLRSSHRRNTCVGPGRARRARLRPVTSRPRPHERTAFPRTPRPGRRPAGPAAEPYRCLLPPGRSP